MTGGAPPTSSRLPAWLAGWPALIGAWMVAIAGLAAWLGLTPPETLRAHLARAQFWSLEVCLLLAVGGIAFVGRHLWRVFGRGDRRVLAMAAALALGLTVLVAPRTPRIFYDEQIYQGIAQNLSDLKQAQMCNDGSVDYGRLQCLRGEYNKQPYAFPHLLGAAYRVVGVRPAVPFVVNAAAMVLTVWAVYAWVLLACADRMAAGFAALIIATIPHQVLWAATGAVEPTASLACLLAVVAATYAAGRRETHALVVVGVLVAYAAQFRPESLLIAGPIAVLLFGRHSKWIGARQTGWVLLLVAGLLAVHVAHLFAVRNEGWGTTGPRLSLAYVWPNLRVNGPFYFGDERFPVLYTALAIVGVLGGAWRVRLAAAVYFAGFFGVGLLFYAGSYNYGADVRYSVLTYPPLAALGGLGAARVVRWAGRRWSGAEPSVVTASGGADAAPPRLAVLATMALLVQTTWYAPVMRATTEEAWAARADVRFAQAFARQLPPHAYVLTQNPAMFHVLGVSAGQMSLVTTNPLYLAYLRMRHPSTVYVHWNYWCNVPDQEQQEYCRRALAAAPVQLVGEYRERDQRFAFYRVEPLHVSSAPSAPPGASAGRPAPGAGVAERADVAESH